MIKQSYFIYLHRRLDTGQVFYVGKGTRTARKKYERAYAKENRNKIWQRVTAKTDFTVEIVADFFTEPDAFALERELILRHGRKIDGGSLANMTLGGEGHCGLSPSAETRRKRSISASGPRSELWIAAIRKARKNGGNGGVVKKGDKLPEWWKERMVASKIGARNPMFGKTGAANHRSRKVKETSTGIVYDSVLLAAEAKNVKMKTLYNWLSGHRPNPTSLEFA